MIEKFKKEVLDANRKLVELGLVIDTFGNVSGIDRKAGLVVIKPSGVSYDTLAPKHMSVVRLADGKLLEGLKPSSDTPTHLELYRAWKNVGGIAHTHSASATVWAQARRDIPALGTTHADYFHGAIPCTRPLTPREIKGEYEANTGKVIAGRFAKMDPLAIPAVVVACHGPFAWGTTADDSVHHAMLLEQVAFTALATCTLNPKIGPIPRVLLDKHFLRKHGPKAYYGQR